MSKTDSSAAAKSSIHSMTGFGRVCVRNDQFSIELEIRSVNHKSLKIVYKLNDQAQQCQQWLEAETKKRINRGSVQITLRLRTLGESSKYQLDQECLRTYLETLRAFASANGLEEPTIQDLLSLPGVIAVNDSISESAEELWQIIKPHYVEGVEKFLASRAEEGSATADEFALLIEDIETRLEVIKSRITDLVTLYQSKLEQRIRKLLQRSDTALDSSELAQQVAYFADKADISEEIQRLTKHCDNFRSALQNKGAVGRRLEFIAQEMLREANTMASKSHGIELLEEILEVKLDIDKIREQTANIE